MQRKFKDLGIYLKESRKKAGLTQIKVSNTFGHSTSQFISNIERGLCGVPYQMLKPLCKIYDMPKKKIVNLIISAERKELESWF